MGTGRGLPNDAQGILAGTIAKLPAPDDSAGSEAVRNRATAREPRAAAFPETGPISRGIARRLVTDSWHGSG